MRSKLKVGKADVRPDKPSHTPGVPMGNEVGHYKNQKGHLPDGTSKADRSTGINPKHRNPIIPGMPNLSPP